jgi:hypothetical protein
VRPYAALRVPKVQHPKTGKKELALFGPMGQTELKQLFCFIRFWVLHFGAKEGWGAGTEYRTDVPLRGPSF